MAINVCLVFHSLEWFSRPSAALAPLVQVAIQFLHRQLFLRVFMEEVRVRENDTHDIKAWIRGSKKKKKRKAYTIPSFQFSSKLGSKRKFFAGLGGKNVTLWNRGPQWTKKKCGWKTTEKNYIVDISIKRLFWEGWKNCSLYSCYFFFVTSPPTAFH